MTRNQSVSLLRSMNDMHKGESRDARLTYLGSSAIRPSSSTTRRSNASRIESDPHTKSGPAVEHAVGLHNRQVNLIALCTHRAYCTAFRQVQVKRPLARHAPIC